MKPDAPVALSRRGMLTGGFALGAGLLLPTRLWALAPGQRLLRLRDPESDRVLNDAVVGGDWWGGASVWRFSDQNYYEIRLRPQKDGGYLTFITGEGAHWTYALAEDLGINVFYGGHYATETFGVKALAAHLAAAFSIPWVFLDHPTGL